MAFMASPARSAVQGIGVEVNPSSVPVGEGTVLSVRVRGGSAENKPVIKTDPSIRVQEAGANKTFQLSIGGGRAQRIEDLVFSYVIRGSKTGTFQINVEIPDGDEILLPDPVTVKFRNKTEQEKKLEPFLRLNLDSKTLYVGQTVPIEVSIYYSEETRLLVQANNRPVIKVDGMLVEEMSDWFEGGRSQGYRRATAKAQLTTLKPGKFKIGPSNYTATLRMPRYLRGGQAKAFELQSDAIDVEVKSLPPTGVPEGFEGLVGSFGVEIDASPLELDSGDPISVTLRVTGEGDFRKVEVPKLASTNGWRIYESERFEEKDRQGTLTGMAFTQVIVPTGKVGEIPSFRLPHFDPAKGAYSVAATNPIPIKLNYKAASAGATASMGVPSAVSSLPVEEVDPPREAMNDILGIRTGFAQSWATGRTSLFGNPLYWAVQAVPALLLGWVIFAAWRRRNNGRDKGGQFPTWQEAWAEFQSGMGSSSSLDFYRRAQACTGAWERTVNANGHGPELEDESEIEEGIRRIRGRHDFFEFGGVEGAGKKEVEPHERERVRKTLERLGEILRGGGRS